MFFIGSGSIRSTEAGAGRSSLSFEGPYDDAVFPCKGDQAQLENDPFLPTGRALKAITEFYQISGGLRLIYEKKEHTFRK